MTVAASLMIILSRATLDDAYITFRYARHLAEGYGFGAWNHTGEHVEGYTSLLWMLLLAGAARLGVDVWIASKVLGIASALIVIAALVWRRDDRPAFLSGLFLALYVPFLLYAASGMEAMAFTSLVRPRGSRSSRHSWSQCGRRARSSRLSTWCRSPGAVSAGDGSSQPRSPVD
jgi:hypothetical protein